MAKTILVVDDSATVQVKMRWTLVNNNYEVYVAEDGLKALTILNQLTPDLIVLDLMMPNLDGLQVCDVIRNHMSNKTIPIIMISSNSDPKNIDKAMIIGANTYLIKPIKDDLLLSEIKQNLSQLH